MCVLMTPYLKYQFADSMIRMSVIVTNRSTDPLCKTTLILAPLALLDQWKMEIETKTNCGLKCSIYHGNRLSHWLVLGPIYHYNLSGNSKTSRKSQLLKSDVVLTTYMVLILFDYQFETSPANIY